MSIFMNLFFPSGRFVAIAIENGGLLSDTTQGLLDELTNRLPANDRQRFNTFARMKLSATIALGTARLIKERLPIRIRINPK